MINLDLREGSWIIFSNIEIRDIKYAKFDMLSYKDYNYKYSTYYKFRNIK